MHGEVTSRNHQAYSRGHLVHYNTVTLILLQCAVLPFYKELQQFFLKVGKT